MELSKACKATLKGAATELLKMHIQVNARERKKPQHLNAYIRHVQAGNATSCSRY